MPTKPTEPTTFMFTDDGSVPNNPQLPLLLYRGVIDLSGTPNPEEVIEKVFRDNRRGDMWRNGVFPYVHYHSMIHEGMAGAPRCASAAHGEEIDLSQGDVVVLPAGTSHQGLWASPDLMVIGAYPKNGRYDLCRGSKSEHAKALKSIPNVPLPDTDPALGRAGPLLHLWRG